MNTLSHSFKPTRHCACFCIASVTAFAVMTRMLRPYIIANYDIGNLKIFLHELQVKDNGFLP
ncbi:hypothetical protein ETA_13960 [Erwinia tasmaniensis Et1/99]|uniref:Uncharacterized protein n=1 Tax=Erwinia tasmaniensis (strain DSM 17950 / CFBP 7177 / CIP 109463 / NCPPB 4357 / Et1/99) TaxID=465817 RepID=B2VFH5_ERWT9|nr:hypothetical protein ETA_13960 [Erwinia tasmaniensis Et1/99]